MTPNEYLLDLAAARKRIADGTATDLDRLKVARDDNVIGAAFARLEDHLLFGNVPDKKGTP